MSSSNNGNRRRSILRICVIVAIAVLVVTWFWKPWTAHYEATLGQIASADRDYDRALKHFQNALRLRPQEASTHFQVARVYRHLGDFSRAREHLRLAEQHGGDSQRTMREQWLMFAQSGRMREAQPHLGDLLATAVEDQREICEAYVRGYLANLRLSEAQNLLSAWTMDFPDDAEAWFLQGSLHEMTSKYLEASDAFRRAANLAPQRIDVKLHLSAMLVELRSNEENHRVLGECVAAEPNNPAVLLAWARSQQSFGELDEAEVTLKNLLKITPQNLDAQKLAGQIALAQQNYSEAIRLLESTLAKRPHDTEARYAYANVLMATGRVEQAKPHFEFVAESQGPMSRVDELVLKAVDRPHDASLRFEIGSTLWKYGAPEDAARWLLSVLELDPHHRGAHQILAEHYAQSGQSDLALHHRRILDP